MPRSNPKDARRRSPLGTTADVAVVILTFNEEKNLAQALDSVCGWAKEVFVFDSFSSDDTLRIASRYACTVAQHPFENFGRQRNAALETLPITAEWVFFLDADEWLTPELRSEISEVVADQPTENGFYVKRRLLWMGSWIKRGYYPTWILRMFRRGKGRCEARSVNEHILLEGTAGQLTQDFMHEDQNGLTRWVEKHNQYATREAVELLKRVGGDEIAVRFWGSQAERTRWIRHRIWNHLPPIARPFLYFSYRYFMRAGFLDGQAALGYHLMQGLWFPLLIDLKYLEMKSARHKATEPAGGDAPADERVSAKLS
jgi:glycosyltransferase involved in cell wall biosynthesis